MRSTSVKAHFPPFSETVCVIAAIDRFRSAKKGRERKKSPSNAHRIELPFFIPIWSAGMLSYVWGIGKSRFDPKVAQSSLFCLPFLAASPISWSKTYTAASRDHPLNRTYVRFIFQLYYWNFLVPFLPTSKQASIGNSTRVAVSRWKKRKVFPFLAPLFLPVPSLIPEVGEKFSSIQGRSAGFIWPGPTTPNDGLIVVGIFHLGPRALFSFYSSTSTFLPRKREYFWGRDRWKRPTTTSLKRKSSPFFCFLKKWRKKTRSEYIFSQFDAVAVFLFVFQSSFRCRAERALSRTFFNNFFTLYLELPFYSSLFPGM